MLEAHNFVALVQVRRGHRRRRGGVRHDRRRQGRRHRGSGALHLRSEGARRDGGGRLRRVHRRRRGGHARRSGKARGGGTDRSSGTDSRAARDFTGAERHRRHAARAARPYDITLDWWRYFLTQNPQWDWTTLTRAVYEQFWDQSVEEFGAVIGTDNPDLSAFRDRGGKIVMWHGQSDQLIYPGGSIDYYTRVQQQMGGRGEDRRVHQAVPGAGRGPLRRRRGPGADRTVRRRREMGRAGQGAGHARRRCGAIRPAPSSVRVRCASIRSSRDTRDAAARTTRRASSAGQGF